MPVGVFPAVVSLLAPVPLPLGVLRGLFMEGPWDDAACVLVSVSLTPRPDLSAPRPCKIVVADSPASGMALPLSEVR